MRRETHPGGFNLIGLYRWLVFGSTSGDVSYGSTSTVSMGTIGRLMSASARLMAKDCFCAVEALLTNHLLRTPRGSARQTRDRRLQPGFQGVRRRYSCLRFESRASQTTPVRPPEIQGQDPMRSDRPRLDSVPPETA